VARPRAGRGRAADARREPVDILEVVTWGGGQPADGFDDDDTPRGPLLPPDDRIWRHPSEVGAALRGRASRVRRRSRLPKPSRNWRIALLAGTIGGMLAAGVAAATDVFGTRTGTSVVRLVRVPPPRSAASSTAGSVATSAGVAHMADVARQRLVLVRVGTEGGGQHTTTGVLLSSSRSDVVVVPEAAVDDAKSVSVAEPGGESVAATIVGDDGDTGVAIMRVPALSSPGSTPPIPDTVPAPTAGQLVVAVALDPGRGVVMGVGTVRSADTQMTTEGRSPYLDVMELDAPLPSGTPGGLVLDGSGTPIGLTLAVMGEGGGQRSYAAPLAVVRDSAGQLAASGHVVHAWLGVEGHDLDSKAAAGLGLTGGAEVTAVQPGSPAAGAGLRGDDVIGEVDGRAVYSMLELRAALRLRRPGDSVTLVVTRGGQQRRAQATLGTEPAHG